MGKYIYSYGNVGLWEESRPLVWPLILGFFWKLDLDAILFGKLILMFFSLGVIILTYLIALEIFNKNIALISCFFLSLSPTLFLFGNILFSGIPSTFFILISIYLLIKKNYKISGLFLGIAVMTRFFQIFTALMVFLFLLYLFIKKKIKFGKIIYFSSFFIVPIVPFLILNFFLYGDILHPFLLQAFMTKYSGWIYHQPLSFYFISLIKENVFILFSILGLAIIFKKEKHDGIFIALLFLFNFILYNFAAHKEMRLLIPIFPFLYILSGYGVVYFANLFKKNRQVILSIILILFLALNLSKIKFDKYDDNLDSFYDYVENNDIGRLWISNPSFIAYSDYKAGLIYYPLYNSEKIDELTMELSNVDNILLNTCDITPCPPSDNLCNEKHDEFLSKLKSVFYLEDKKSTGNCEYYIFSK